MKLELLKFLADMLFSIEKLETYRFGELPYSVFEQNFMMIDAAERRLIIIGEALYHADKPDKFLPITDKKKIIGLRYILVHDDDKVNPETLYAIITKYLGLLKTEVVAILEQHPLQGPITLDD